MHKVRKWMVAMLASLALVSPAQAQWLTLDIPNLIQTIMGVISDYQQEATQMEQLYQLEQQLEAEYRQLKSLSSGDVSGLLGTVRTALANVQNYRGSIQGLYGDVGNAKNVATELYNRMGASGLSQEEWMKREAERNQANQEGNGFLTNYQATVLGQVEKRYEEVRNLQGKITSTEGTHESMQLMNSQMNVLLATTNQLLEHNATLAQRSVTKDVEETGRAKSTADGYAAWLESQRKDREEASKKINAMGKKSQ